MKNSRLKPEALEALYRQRYETVLKPLASALADHIADRFKGQPRIDRISTRAKDVSSFLNKAKKIDGRRQKYSEPLHQIQDQVERSIITSAAHLQNSYKKAPHVLRISYVALTIGAKQEARRFPLATPAVCNLLTNQQRPLRRASHEY